jgi:membrane-associated protease RseP (regulator of RpoE activity)
VTTFSIGFGPALWSHRIGDTRFKIGTLPFGGYVEIDEEELKNASSLKRSIIYLSGVGFNFLSMTLVLLLFLGRWKRKKNSSMETIYRKDILLRRRLKLPFLGPFYFVKVLSVPLPHESNTVKEFALKFADISHIMGWLNLLPIVFLFDGGKVYWEVVSMIDKTLPSSLAFFANLIIGIVWFVKCSNKMHS